MSTINDVVDAGGGGESQVGTMSTTTAGERPGQQHGGAPAPTPSSSSSLMISSGLSSSLHGSATTLGTNYGGGFGSAFGSPGAVVPGVTFGRMTTTTPGTPGTMTTTTPVTTGMMMTPGGTSRAGTAGGDRRSLVVRERSRSSAAFARMAAPPPPPPSSVGKDRRPSTTASRNNGNAEDDDDASIGEGIAGEEDIIDVGPALFTSFCHRGTEVIFAAINNSFGNNEDEDEGEASSCHLLVIHARTRVPFQKCHIDRGPTSTTTPSEIVQLTSHPTTGYVFAADDVGNVHSFHPSNADPMTDAYGKFRWRRGAVARCREVFGYPPPPPPVSSSMEPPPPPPMAAAMRSLSLESMGGEDGDGIEISDSFSIDRRMPSPMAALSSGRKALAPRGGGDGLSIDGTSSYEGDVPPPPMLPVACFRRRRRRRAGARLPPRSSSPPRAPWQSPSPPSGGRKDNGSGSRGSYPLTDGQPPLPIVGGNDGDDGECYYGGTVTISASATERRVLVAHRDQLAVFDFSSPRPPPKGSSGDAPQSDVVVPPPPSAFKLRHDANNDHDETASSPPPYAATNDALLLWTHKLQGSAIDRASISGDGRAIALALRGEGEGVPYPFGVRTFVRDEDDGSTGGIGGGQRVAASGGGAAGVVESDATRKGAGERPVRHRRAGSGLPPMPVHRSPPPPPTNDDSRRKRPPREDGDDDAAAPKTPSSASSSTTTANDNGDTPVATSQGVEVIPNPTTDAPRGGPPSGTKGAAASPAAAAVVARSRGILYKPAQFLVHSAPVTRLAFRGHGAVTSSARRPIHNNNDEDDDGGNDLLLTTCSADNSVRIFSQNSWRQLMHWNSPPRSRADWVGGISAANLGDLDGSPGGGAMGGDGGREEGRRPPTHRQPGMEGRSDGAFDDSTHSRNSFGSATNGGGRHPPPSPSDASANDDPGGINAMLAGAAHSQRITPTPSNYGFPAHSVPGTHAGAWIAELTFRNSFPALRLSRLSYMKTGESFVRFYGFGGHFYF